MILFRAIVSLLLVAFWLPSSSHALLEHFEVIHQVHADHDADAPDSHQHEHEHDADNHEAADGKCALSSPHVCVPLPESVAMPILFCAPGLNWTAQFPIKPPPPGLAPPGTAPPSWPSGWQFFFRTALPGRAPSLAS